MARGAEEVLQESGSATPAGTGGGQREAAAAGLCPICLGDVDNAAHVDTCLHTFCFGCIRQWAAVRAACPLCRQRFGRILHTVRADDDYEEITWNKTNDLPPTNSEGERDAAGLPGSRPKGGKPESGVKSVAQLKCMYTNAHSMDYKQEELEATVQYQSYDVAAITEMWWDESRGWSTALDGYKLFGIDRKGRRGGGVALYIRAALDAISIETNDNEVE
ncbi:hypothetical protein DUI87_04048 [Hirundo rustica rustica]|uniref:E3 ubiquitin-protein ligase Topors n=1 Tax=Hirundo rustica rustica TaxID=333673 RepID=A0A3M0LJZ3_HIRRU|nr:hypothetical protein DUI87_04048 [Hirundo rustica rustica]